jgi:TolB-like protein
VRLDEKVARFTLALPDKPSIAVLPFQNMSGDPQQDYFADGVVEDIITALSRIRWLFVIARNSSFTYKGRALDIKQIGRELGVRYVLEGGIRKAGARVRITGQLIDAVTGTHIWAERFEGDLVDIFELQDRITSSVVGAIEPALRTAEILRVQAKPTSSLDAYDYFLRASAATHGLTRADYAEALLLCKKAIATDPHYASAYGLCAWIYLWRCVQSWTDQPEEERAEALKLARSAVEFGGENPEALWMAGHVISFFAGDGERGMELIRRSLSLNPNSAHAHTCAGYVGWHLGQGDTAVEHFQSKSLGPPQLSIQRRNGVGTFRGRPLPRGCGVGGQGVARATELDSAVASENCRVRAAGPHRRDDQNLTNGPEPGTGCLPE